jgi:hypothetical protein
VIPTDELSAPRTWRFELGWVASGSELDILDIAYHDMLFHLGAGVVVLLRDGETAYYVVVSAQ